MADEPGRPTVITESVVAKLTEAFQLGANDTSACEYAQIDRSTFYRHLKGNPDFATKIKATKREIEYQARAALRNAIEAGDIKTSMWWLEKKAREEFGLSKPHTNNVTKPSFGSPDMNPAQVMSRMEEIDAELIEIFKRAGLKIVPDGEETEVTKEINTTEAPTLEAKPKTKSKQESPEKNLTEK